MSVTNLKDKAFSVVCSKLESEHHLQNSLRLLANSGQGSGDAGNTLSSIEYSTTKHFSFDEESEFKKTFTLEIATDAYYHYTGRMVVADTLEERDIVGRVVLTVYDVKVESPIETFEYPVWAMIAKLGHFLRIRYDMGPLRRLINYTKDIYAAGFRVFFHEINDNVAEFMMCKGQTQVTITVFIKQLKDMEFLYANLDPMFLDMELIDEED